MRHVFRVKDFQDVNVILRWTTWKNHILRRHPEMQNYLDALKITITGPSRVHENTNYTHGLSLWKLGLGKRKRTKQWICVVVNYKRNPFNRRWHGEVVTACFANKVPDIKTRIK